MLQDPLWPTRRDVFEVKCPKCSARQAVLPDDCQPITCYFCGTLLDLTSSEFVSDKADMTRCWFCGGRADGSASAIVDMFSDVRWTANAKRWQEHKITVLRCGSCLEIHHSARDKVVIGAVARRQVGQLERSVLVRVRNAWSIGRAVCSPPGSPQCYRCIWNRVAVFIPREPR